MTGTDTGVGKTAVACGILGALRKKGVDVGAFKPVESGHAGNGGAWPPDAAALAKAAGLAVSRDSIVPYVFREPLAPATGAPLENVRIDLDLLDRAWFSMQAAHQLSIVEGAGGIAVPLDHEHTMADLAVRWKLPVLLVARPGLGTINHTVLSIEYIERRGLTLLGVVINGYPEAPTTAEQTGYQEIRRMTMARILGRVPKIPGIDVDGGKIETMSEAVASNVDLGPVLELVGGGR